MRKRIAIVHDALVNMGGAERVVGILHELFPDAPLFTSAYNPKNTYSVFRDADTRTTLVQKFAVNEIAVKLMMPICINEMKKFKLNEYDVVISSAAWCAKNIFPREDALYICYCYAPFRLLWNSEHYLKNKFLRKIMKKNLEKLRRHDFESAQRVKYFLTSCENTAKKIKDCYNRDAQVLYPPIDIKRFIVSNRLDNYFLTVSRMVPYKRLDIAIQAFNELGLPFKIVGDGPQRKTLQRLARKNIQFLGNVSDTEIVGLYSRAIAFINTAEEDYGIVSLEAQASGRPVIAYGAGGVLETVVPINKNLRGDNNIHTGIFFLEQNKDSLIEAVIKFKTTDFDSNAIREHVAKFDITIFKRKMIDFIREKAALQNLDVSWIEEYV